MPGDERYRRLKRAAELLEVRSEEFARTIILEEGKILAESHFEVTRAALAYAVSDLYLKDVAAWASALDVAEMTGPSLFYRLREAEGWLEHVSGRVLAA